MTVTTQPTEFDVHDQHFLRCVDTTARLEILYTGCRFGEGPAYFPAQRSLIWSDIPNDRMLRFDETSQEVGVFRSPSRFANGNTRDNEGRLVTCEQGTRSVVRTEHSGARTVLADTYQGRRLNSPNDVVVGPDGSIWFSDPTYGIDSDYEGNLGESEIGAANVYRVVPSTGETVLAADGFVQPNGLALSADGSSLYAVDSGFTHDPDGPRHIRRFTVEPAATLSGGEAIAECDQGIFDGLRLDADGRIWTSAGDGVRCLAPDGRPLGSIRVPEVVSNVEFGGQKLNELYITGASCLYRIRVSVNGARVTRHW
ncbi:SMP-30/gluconolactonase/LRE family protein [Streptomyces shenzhenensis]|uniref:SMP-30/gluconolactonase/LRE family protein n=1 Tax=Streptomyces shenzhenensis TaxID=943815 RepID=UPI0033C0AB8C